MYSQMHTLQRIVASPERRRRAARVAIAVALGSVTAVWSAYVVMRPLGASITDWLASSRSDGRGLGTGRVTLGATVAIVVLRGAIYRFR